MANTPLSLFSTSTINNNAFRKNEGKCGKIPFSSVVVRPRRRAYWRRKWEPVDVMHVVGLLCIHMLCMFAPFNFSWGAFSVALTLYVVTGLFGVTLSYHRQLSHKSFKLHPKWVEYLFAYFAAHSMQGGPLYWVGNHRFHHKFTDTDQDLHSPAEGFWFSHFTWLFNENYIIQKCGKRNNVEDLRKQWFYRFMESTHMLHAIALGVLLYIFGGFPYLVWGMGVRVTCGFHITFLLSSACHVWGHQAWNTGDLSKNNWFVNMFAFGEGWHNNHHAFEYSARHGLEWWQIDMTWYVIKLLEFIGVATDIKLPSESHKQRLSFNLGSEDVKQVTEIKKTKNAFQH